MAICSLLLLRRMPFGDALDASTSSSFYNPTRRLLSAEGGDAPVLSDDVRVGFGPGGRIQRGPNTPSRSSVFANRTRASTGTLFQSSKLGGGHIEEASRRCPDAGGHVRMWQLRIAFGPQLQQERSLGGTTYRCDPLAVTAAPVHCGGGLPPREPREQHELPPLQAQKRFQLFLGVVWESQCTPSFSGPRRIHRRRHAISLELRLNLAWNHWYTPLRRLIFQDCLHPCGYYDMLHEATASNHF
ncbi:uncharacterized protein B0H18DRAFT_1115083 [Fomitopsis serialis]|uniref:uncharacterized protein n=1 Tax=Fomitopsis serialis TaxID=139415 RepID=UPI0020075BB9|nr:uncharacterized protein B0H18DRAFT_1115083 [Neoantrodia serialis]KAH9934377.1 hypothetical protein B0H18DRAFT_1115083 [Neoantrodia serialis]